MGGAMMKTRPDFSRQGGVECYIGIVLGIFLLAGFLVTDNPAMASDNDRGKDKKWVRKPAACAQTSQAALAACRYSASSDYYLGIGACNNIAERQDKQVCLDEIRDTLKEDTATCNEQFQARQEVCRELGKGPYDPDISSDNFTSDINNTYFPLKENDTYIYQQKDGDEILQTIVVKVGGTTTINGFPCRVVTDKVFEGEGTSGNLLEDTIDWFAQDLDGNVWYFGETTIAYTYDEYGNPTASTEGSWMAGVDGAKPGIIMYADPSDKIGLLYRQEFALGTAEDLGKVVGINESVTADGKLCNGCVHTEDSTPFEPGLIEDKYYAPGKGLVLTIDPDGTREELISITP
jgi:hypothetical protein